MNYSSLINTYIYGAGGFGMEVAAYLRRNLGNTHQLKSFFDDEESKKLCLGLPVHLPNENHLEPEAHYILGMGMPAAKMQAFQKLKNIKAYFPSIIDLKAELIDSNTIQIGNGVLLAPGVICTTHIELGDFVMLNLNVTVGHETRIGAFSSIMPGVHISGTVNIGKGVMIGTGAVLLNGVQVGDGAIVGAGAVVTRNVAAGELVVGIPAKARN